VSWLWLALLFPLVGAALNGAIAIAGARAPRWVTHAIALGSMVGAATVAIAAALLLVGAPPEARRLVATAWTLLPGPGPREPLALVVDPLSATLMLVITVVGALIHVYATGYMAADRAPARFFAALNLFVAAMLLLVLGSSLVTLFFGWEGVGLCSWLLIGFWYEEPENARAAMKAFVVNRIGDLGLLLGMALLAWRVTGGALSFDAVVAAGAQADGGVLTAALVLLVVGAAGKSAQLPLSIWLPDAMAGPTPVSALIHAATMVTAGVYLLVRLGPLFARAPHAMTLVVIVGLATALWAAAVALAQRDLKRVLAYSTISQLGFMFLGAGVGAGEAALFHVVTHALFKALLFLAAGVVIHAVHEADHHAGEHGDPQAMARMGGLATALPWTRRAYLIGCWAIAGMPWAAGFFSKDAILGATLTQRGWPPFLAATAAAGLTSLYMFRSYYLVFRARPPRAALAAHAVELLDKKEGAATRRMIGVLMVLAAAVLVAGPLLGLPEVVTGHATVLARWLAPVTGAASSPRHAASSSLELVAMALSLAAAVAGWALARALWADEARGAALRQRLASLLGRLEAPARDGFGLDALAARAVAAPCSRAAATVAAFDRGVVDGVVAAVAALARGAAWLSGALDRHLVDGAVNGVARLVVAGGRSLRRAQTGRVSTYVLVVVLGVLLLGVLTTLGAR
jgi:NADH-quinone oxidoreductase subunit L